MRRRRERRMRRTQQSEAEVRAWAERYGLALRVLNNGHHWILDKSGFIAEWWPSSAKLALNRDYHRSFRAPHWPDVLVVLERTFARSPVTS
jgi:predicted kinase